MDQHGPKWTKVDQSGPKWTKVDQSGPKWTNMDQSGPKWTNMDQDGQILSACWSWGRCTRSNLPPAPLQRSSPAQDGPLWKSFLIIVIVVFSFINDNLNRYDLETFEHLRSSPGLPCNVPSAGSRFASCLYVHTWPSTLRRGKRKNHLKSN